MPKLYYNRDTSSAASFIAAFTLKLDLEVEQVDIDNHLTSLGEDYFTINPKGNVPALILKDGTLLNEGSAILQWIADQRPDTLAPINGTTERYLLQNILNYIASQVQPAISGFFSPNTEEVKEFLRTNAAQHLTFLENYVVADRSFVLGNSFSVADAYLHIVLAWHPYVSINFSYYPKLIAYNERMENLPNVKAAKDRMAENPKTLF